MSATPEELAVIEAAEAVTREEEHSLKKLHAALYAMREARAPKGPMSAEERARRWTEDPMAGEHALAKSIREAESAAFSRGAEMQAKQTIELIAAYHMLLPVYFQSDVDRWKSGIILSINEDVARLKAIGDIGGV